MLHLTTKYIGGHSDAVGGALLTDDEELDTAFAFLQNGAVRGARPVRRVPDDAGAQDVALRMQRHSENAALVAEFLDNHPAFGTASIRDRPATW